MSDTDGADRSNGNGSYIDWLEKNWDSFGSSDAKPQEQPQFITHPFMGHPLWQPQTVSAQFTGWLRGMKLGLMMTGGIIALSGAWNALSWLVNNGQTGFGR